MWGHLVCVFATAVGLVGLGSGLAAAADPISSIPDGVIPATPGDRGGCENQIAFHDNTDDSPGVGLTLGGQSAPYWYLGVRFAGDSCINKHLCADGGAAGCNPPPGCGCVGGGSQGCNPYGPWRLVTGVTFFSEFWIIPGFVTIHAYEIDNPGNAADVSILIGAGGDYEVAFESPICVDSDFGVVFCPAPGVWGVLGEDYSAPQDPVDYQNSTEMGGCELINLVDGDLLVTACVSNCGPTPIGTGSWGIVKVRYR